MPECLTMDRECRGETKFTSAQVAAGHILTGEDSDEVRYRYRGLLVQKDVYGEHIWDVCADTDGEQYLEAINMNAVRTASELLDLLDRIVDDLDDEFVTGGKNGTGEVEG